MKSNTFILTISSVWLAFLGTGVQAQSLPVESVSEVDYEHLMLTDLSYDKTYYFLNPLNHAVTNRSVDRQYSRSAGRAGKMLKGLRTGFGIGGAAGGLIGAATWRECTEEGWGCLLHPDTRGKAFLIGSLIGALFGGSIGLISGTFAKNERAAKSDVNLHLKTMQTGPMNYSFTPALSVNLRLKGKQLRQ